MKFFRQKFWVVFFFALISLGQGFSLSAVLNFSKNPDISSNPKSSILICGHALQESLKENPKPHQKSHEEILSLKTDSFLPSFFSFPIFQAELTSLKTDSFFISSYYSSPPEKPPRLS